MSKYYRPKLDKDAEDPWRQLIEVARKDSPEEVLERYFRTFNNSKESVDRSEDGTDYIISTQSERIRTLDDLIEATEIDTDQFEIYRYISNKYDQHSVEKGLIELYQVKAWMKKKYLDKPDAKYYNEWLSALERVVPKAEFSTGDLTEKPVVLAIADFHCGAIIEGDHLTPDYNVEALRERLDYIARVVNTQQRPVHVAMLGDFVESFSGLNHKNTWKQIEMHGMEVALTVYDLMEEFLYKLLDVRSVNIIGGNHDRITASNEEDKQGQVAYLIAEMLKRFTNMNISFDPRILSKRIDNVQYILTHGDKKISKKQPSDMILEYGDQELFNVMLNAHGHEELIHKNSARFQARQIPPIVVGGQYSKDLGVSANSGFTLIERSPRNGVIIQTIPL